MSSSARRSTKRSRTAGQDDDEYANDSQPQQLSDEVGTSSQVLVDDEPPPVMMYLSQTDNPNTPYQQNKGNYGGHMKHDKSVQDRIHGQVVLRGLLVAVMDTAAFQRLDRIKQLGGCSFVYPSTSHTRKEHSIGVAHLAGEMGKHLAKTQPDLNIDDDDILCLELAGLVHDLGHGPFSHMFEHFMHLVEKKGGEAPWEHENMSAQLLRYLIDANDIPVHEYFDCDTAQAECHINFVVKLIEGLKDESPWPDDLGRGEQKRFLFDIVANKRNGIDVDKLDYLVRDSMAAFGSSHPPGFDIYRIIKSSKVAFREGDIFKPEVVYQMKNALEILEVYSLRAKLHRQVYQHRIANVVEHMITDVFLAANDGFRMRGADGECVRLSDAARNPRSFVRLTDAILDAIDVHVITPDASESGREGLHQAWDLLDRIKKRDFYKQVGKEVNIDTLPLCGNTTCRRGTQVTDRHCAVCGERTVSRKAIMNPKTALYESEGVALTVETVQDEILKKLDAHIREDIVENNALLCKIVDIQYGKLTSKSDPWETKKTKQSKQWAVYDPFARVGLYNPKALRPGNMAAIEHIVPEQIARAYLPASFHTRTLWCYLRCEGEGVGRYGIEWRQALEEAIAKWSVDRALTEQMGSSNSASPAVHVYGVHTTPKMDSAARRGQRSSQLAPEGLDSRLGSIPESSGASGVAAASGLANGGEPLDGEDI